MPNTRNNALPVSIFISHASEDSHAASDLKVWLERTFQPSQAFASSVMPGTNWRAAVKTALQQCKVAVVLATEHSLSKPWVHQEVGALLLRDVPVIPLCCGFVRKNTLPSSLNHLQALNFDDPQDWSALLVKIGQMTGVPGTSTLPPGPPTLAISHGVGSLFAVDRRIEAKGIVRQMLEEARDTKGEICIAGIANTWFFSADGGELQPLLAKALQAGARARFLFLDPSSVGAERRGVYEHRVERPIRTKQ